MEHDTIPEIKLFELGPTRSARVRWTLLEAGLNFESVENGIDIFKSDELRDIHPLSKVPAVLIDGQPLFESAAIVTAIADFVPEKSLIAKAGSWERNLHNQWVCFILSELEPFVQSTEINTYDFVLSKEQHVPEIIEQNNLMFKKNVSVIESHLTNFDFMVGNRFSVTDIILAYTLCWGQEQHLLDACPRLNDYMDTLYAREFCTLSKPK